MTTDATSAYPTSTDDGAIPAPAPEPTDTEHPTGEDQADDNTDNEPPA